jgi:hypothetical protein
MQPQDFKLILMTYFEQKDLGLQVSELIVLHGQTLTSIFDDFHQHRLQHSLLRFLPQGQITQAMWLHFIDTKTDQEWTEGEMRELKNLVSVMNAAHEFL